MGVLRGFCDECGSAVSNLKSNTPPLLTAIVGLLGGSAYLFASERPEEGYHSQHLALLKNFHLGGLQGSDTNMGNPAYAGTGNQGHGSKSITNGALVF